MTPGFLENVKGLLPFIIIGAGLIATWVKFGVTVATLKDRMDEMDKAFVVHTSAQNDIKVQLSQIQTDLQWIKAKLSK